MFEKVIDIIIGAYYIHESVFLALKKVRVRQYKDSDSKPWSQHKGAASSERPRNAIATPGGRGACPTWNFCFRQGFRCLLVIFKGTFQALKTYIFHKKILDIYHCRQNGMFFSSKREACRQF